MSYKQIVTICALILLLSCASPVLAESVSSVTNDVGVFTSLNTGSEYGIAALPVTGFISQGETKSYLYYIPNYADRLEIYLEWGSYGSNNLSLGIHDSFNSYGPFYDIDDGIQNGLIYLISTTFPKGCIWTFDVNGENVIGIQEFTLTINGI